jgi:hypothetical protein
MALDIKTPKEMTAATLSRFFYRTDNICWVGQACRVGAVYHGLGARAGGRLVDPHNKYRIDLMRNRSRSQCGSVQFQIQCFDDKKILQQEIFYIYFFDQNLQFTYP